MGEEEKKRSEEQREGRKEKQTLNYGEEESVEENQPTTKGRARGGEKFSKGLLFVTSG